MNIIIDVVTKPIKVGKGDLLNKIYTEVSGVYVMKDIGNTTLYVGKTVNLSSRMSGHRRDSLFYREAEFIEFYPFSNEYKKDVLETYLINELKPVHNIEKTYYLQEDYGLMLDDINEEIDEIQSELSYRGMCEVATDPYTHDTLDVDLMDEYEFDNHLFDQREGNEEMAELE